MGLIKPFMELSKTFTDPVGGEIIDKLISNISIFGDALANDDMVTILRILKESVESVEELTPLLNEPSLRAHVSERLDGLKKVVNCFEQNECGIFAILLYIFEDINPLKTLFSTLSN